MKDNKNTVLDEQKENKEVWPGRYEVDAMVDYFPDGFGVYKDVWLTLVNDGMTSEEDEGYNLDFKTSAYYDVRHDVYIRNPEDEATARSTRSLPFLPASDTKKSEKLPMLNL